jgi:hypothetical protein
VAVAAEAMRQAMGPTWDKPTRADLMVVKKRLDARLDFDRAPTAVQQTHDVNCLRVVEGLR